MTDHAKSALDEEVFKYGNAGLYSVASIDGKDSLLKQTRLSNPTPAQVNKRVLAANSTFWVPSISQCQHSQTRAIVNKGHKSHQTLPKRYET
jgi:hypothetical protein